MTSRRFDEIELRRTGPAGDQKPVSGGSHENRASLWRRGLAVLVDLSLLTSLILAFKPLHPPAQSWLGWAALAAFLLLFSLHYFISSWMVWGRTLGAAIVAIRIATEDQAGITFKRALRRWMGTILSILSAGIGFLLAAIPPHLSLSDRLSDTIVVRSG